MTFLNLYALESGVSGALSLLKSDLVNLEECVHCLISVVGVSDLSFSSFQCSDVIG